MTDNLQPDRLGMCFSCQHRMDWLRKGMGFRYECQKPTFAAYCCYGYVPALPVVLEKADKKDKRPFPAPAMLASRANMVREVENGTEFRLHAIRARDGIVLYWAPKRVRSGKATRKGGKAK